MKRSLASLLIGMGSLAFSFGAFANVKNFSGEGTWKSSTGETGTHTVALSVEETSDSTLSFTETVNVADKSFSFQFSVQKLDDTFYSILDKDGKVIGSGYCFGMENNPDGKVCHSYVGHGGHHVELSFECTGDAIYRLGSKTMQNKVIAWKDALHLVDEAKH